jgi:threonylcarbamoyladenosine tRNA methylthiotransferase MtaB
MGCRLNQYESNAVVGQFLNLDWIIAEQNAVCEMVLIDTCTVTDRADQKARQQIRSIIRKNPTAVIVVMGCYTQSNSDEIAVIKGVDYILGNAEKINAPACITDFTKQNSPRVFVDKSNRKDDRRLLQVESFEKQTRAYLKIQDGCDIFCSFCIVPFTRGRSRSMHKTEIITQAKKLIDKGYQEIVLTGVHIGDYGKEEIQPERLPELIAELFKIPGFKRLRLSTIEPWDITVDLLQLIAQEQRFCKHIHTAIQSGSDRVLAAMRRRIDAKKLNQLFDNMQRYLPGLGLGTDVMVGFPGETTGDFEDTVKMVEQTPFSYLHVFPYSIREGTKAAEMGSQIDNLIKKERSRILLDLAAEKMRRYHENNIGLETSILVENNLHDGYYSGLTDTYIKVQIPVTEFESAQPGNTFRKVKLIADRGSSVLARLLP